jgi:hypothetical protein
MKKALKFLAIAIALAAAASAQNWTTVTASNITDLNQTKLAAGQLCFLVTDQNDNPISVNIGGGGQNLKRPYCSTVTTGAAAAFAVPNPASTNPSGIYYRVTVKDTSTGLEVLRYTQVTFTGGSFNFDNYAPQNVSAPAPINNSVNGNFTVNGNESITGTSTAGSYTTSTRGDRQIVLQNPDFEGSSVLPPPGWRNLANTAGIYYSYETSSPAPGKTQSFKLSTTAQNTGLQSVIYFSAIPGDNYTVTAMAKSDGAGTASLGIACYNDTAAGSTFVFVGYAAQATTTSTTWVQITASGIVPTNAVSCIPALQNTSATQPSSVWFDQISVQKTNFRALALTSLLESATAPTIASGFGTSPSVTVNNGTANFRINVGTGGTASSGVIGLPTAVNGWDCDCEDRTTFSTTVFKCRQTADTATSATVGSFSSSAGSTPWAASDILAVSCRAR